MATILLAQNSGKDKPCPYVQLQTDLIRQNHEPMSKDSADACAASATVEFGVADATC
jgi:hypothetical protein